MRFVLILAAVLLISAHAAAQVILGNLGLKNLLHGRDRHAGRHNDDRRNGLISDILATKKVLIQDHNHGRNGHDWHRMQSQPDRWYSNMCPCPVDAPGNQWTHQPPPPSQYPGQYHNNDYPQGMKGPYSNQFYDDWNGRQPLGPRPPPPPPPPYNRPGPPPPPPYNRPGPPPPGPYNRPGPPPPGPYNRPGPEQQPDYNRPGPPPPPPYNRPGPEQQPDYNRPGPPPPPPYNRPGPEQQPDYNRPGPPPPPPYNRPGPEQQPDYNRPGPEPQPNYNRPGPESQPNYNRPGPEAQPDYKRPIPTVHPDYNGPEESTPRLPKPTPSSNSVTANEPEIHGDYSTEKVSSGRTTEPSTEVEFVKESYVPSSSSPRPEALTVDAAASDKGATKSPIQSQSTTEFDWNNYFPQVSADNPGGAGVIDIRGDNLGK